MTPHEYRRNSFIFTPFVIRLDRNVTSTIQRVKSAKVFKTASGTRGGSKALIINAGVHDIRIAVERKSAELASGVVGLKQIDQMRR
jgi:hypothetical protein